MSFAKFTLFFMLCTAFFTGSLATNCNFSLYDNSNSTTFSVQFFDAIVNATNATGYTIEISSSADQQVVTTGMVNGLVNCSADWSRNVTITNTKNLTMSQWFFTNEPSTSQTYITATVQYNGALPIVLSYTSQSLSVSNSTILNVTGDLPVVFTAQDNLLTLNNKAAFFKLKTDSIVFYYNGTETNKTDSNIIITPDSTTSTITLDFDNYPVENTAVMIAKETITVYAGTGVAPGGRLLLIILISVSGAVVLSIVLFAAIFVVRRRRSYERIE